MIRGCKAKENPALSGSSRLLSRINIQRNRRRDGADQEGGTAQSRLTPHGGCRYAPPSRCRRRRQHRRERRMPHRGRARSEKFSRRRIARNIASHRGARPAWRNQPRESAADVRPPRRSFRFGACGRGRQGHAPGTGGSGSSSSGTGAARARALHRAQGLDRGARREPDRECSARRGVRGQSDSAHSGGDHAGRSPRRRPRQSGSRSPRALRRAPAPPLMGFFREEIAKAVAAHPVVIVCGETGSGKTTQLPKICLELGRGIEGLIGHTQPRRIAARATAARVAQELKTELGGAVGYKIRFTDRVGARSYIKVMTDGILLAETQGARELRQYDTLIIDEAHERSLNIDFLLGYIRQLLPRRPDLKLIVTSATIDAERFSKHFDGAPVIEVSGRLYPIEVRYRPFEEEDDDSDINQAIGDAVEDLARLGQGDVLVFLPGEREIREAAEALRKRHPPHTEILPLYARLSAEEQGRVFGPHAGRRIVLATNVAETSLTVPGIRYVVDSGLARLKRYSYRNKVEQLRVENISQASAKQRAGRCGRVASGVCVRLYAEDEFNSRPAFTDPEVLRSSLASVILRMKSLGLGTVEEFPFIDPPASKAIQDGYALLAELGAVDEANELTEIGEQLAKLPADPRIGRMVLAAESENALGEVLVIAAALSVQDPRQRPSERAAAADEAQKQFDDDKSDFLSWLKLWKFFEEGLAHGKSSRKLHEACREHFLSFNRMREWRDIHGQLMV